MNCYQSILINACHFWIRGYPCYCLIGRILWIHGRIKLQRLTNFCHFQTCIWRDLNICCINGWLRCWRWCLGWCRCCGRVRGICWFWCCGRLRCLCWFRSCGRFRCLGRSRGCGWFWRCGWLRSRFRC